MSMQNPDVAEIFKKVADLLEIEGHQASLPPGRSYRSQAFGRA
jgi:DNA polymerase/3'-5' exonuclease PolX